MAKFSKSNFRLIIQEIEEAEKCLENIWIPIGILEIMYDDYSGIIDKYFHSEEKDRDIDKLWDNLQPESKVTSKDLCINVAPKNPNVHNTLPYWYTQQYDRDFSNVGHITVPCSNKEE